MGVYIDRELTEATTPSKAVPKSRSLDTNPKIQECDEHTWFVVRLRIGQLQHPLRR